MHGRAWTHAEEPQALFNQAVGWLRRHRVLLPGVRRVEKGQLLTVKHGVEQILERLILTDDERAALAGDRDALARLAERLAKVPTSAGPTPEQLGR